MPQHVPVSRVEGLFSALAYSFLALTSASAYITDQAARRSRENSAIASALFNAYNSLDRNVEFS